MKTYDFSKAKQLISENAENLVSASLGMHEDWAWTAETIWENGNYKRELPDNADEMNEQFIEARKNGLSMFLADKDENGLSKFNPEYDKLTKHEIAGIYGSTWATPAIELIFKDGEKEMHACYKGESSGSRSPFFQLGVLSQQVQDNITPLS